MIWNDKISFPKIVATGCARSGTFLLSDILSQGGIIMGHETLFGEPGYGTFRENMVGDVATLAMPFLNREKGRGAKILQIVRHPLKQMSSMIHGDSFADYAFNGNPFARYVAFHLPDIMKHSELDRYIFYWLVWNQQIASYVDLIYRLEDIIQDPYEIFKDLDWDLKGKKIKVKKMNAFKKKVKQYDWKDFKGCLYYNELLKGAAYYGYLTDKEAKKLMNDMGIKVVKNGVAKKC